MSFPVSRPVAAFLLAMLAVPVFWTPAAGLEILGFKLWESRAKRDETAAVVDPLSYSLTFDVARSDTDIDNRLKAASSLWIDREKPASGAAGLIAMARGDYRALLGTLYREGYYGGTISIRINGQEAARMPFDAVVPENAVVELKVDPGPVFTFGGAGIINAAPPATEADDEVETPESVGYASGEIARSSAVKDAARLSVLAWRQQGYAKARISDKNIVADHDVKRLDAELTVDPGRKAFYDVIAVEGTGRLDPEFLAWMTGIQPGEEYDPDDLARASKRLARLDVLSSQRFVEADEIGDTGVLPISLVVQERKPRRIGLGATYSNVDGFGVEAYWLHRNLFGRAEKLRLEGSVAGLGRSSNPDDFDYGLSATFTKPGFFTPDTDLIIRAAAKRELLPGYRRTAGGGEILLQHLFSNQLSAHLGVYGEYARYNDVFGTRDFTLAGLRAGAIHDSRDNAADATRGVYLSGEIDTFHDFTFANTAVRGLAEARAYVSPDKNNRLVIAGRVKAGMIAGAPLAQTPPDKLFFAGGGGSVRGYGFKAIGVNLPAGLSGGRSLLETSLELRFRATETLGLVGFVDAGMVGAGSTPNFSDMRVGAGAGIRYYTALGPLRLDVAVPLDRRPGDTSFAVYAGIGQAF